jgi:asparagine synthase (glutamine-hydrolysing)
MCGIVVSELNVFGLEEGMHKIDKRGPDSKKFMFAKNNVFLFNRLSIMGLSEKGMQPFSYGDNVLVANAEIYNYKHFKADLSHKYQFISGSDCEILLPLYEELGTSMFSLLDAEFAIVLYDSKKDSIVAARDPLGIRPLFYGRIRNSQKMIFASEVKAIIDLVDIAYPFPPGHFYINGEFTIFSDVLKIEGFHDETLDETLAQIKNKLTEAIIKRLDSDASMGFLLSGGLDSSLVCAVAARHFDKPIRTYSIGMDKDPIDLKYAAQVANYLNTIHEEVIITKEDILSSLDDVVYALETYDITTIRASMGMYLIARHIHETSDIKVLMTGEVSDELFGYKYTDFAPSEEAFQKECIKRIDEIYMYDVLRADRCLAINSLEARVPFGDIDFASYVMRIHPSLKMNKYNQGKYLLRKAFEGDYLPKDILYRDKAAFSDAVGHSLVDYLKEYAENCYSDDEYEETRHKYLSPVPFTKESLLYREIFEKHFPKHSHLVKDYWMPNKEWDGCNVLDPSARVLSNYGNSGK